MSSKAPRFERRITRQVAPINAAAGAEFGALAQELERFSSQRAQDLDRQADESGFLAGTLAGDEGAEADANDRNIRGRAFNRGVLVSHQAALQTDIRDSVERFELENQRDPDAFNARVEGLLDGLLEEADPKLQSFVRQRAADYAGRATTRIIARRQTKLLAEAAEDLKRGAEGLFDDATTAAFEGDVLMIETRRQELTGLLDEAVAAEISTEGSALEVLENFERKVTAQEVIGNFDRLVRAQGPDAGAESIARWQDVKPSDVGLTAEDHAAVTRQLVTLRNREISLNADAGAKESAAIRADRNERRDRINDSISVLRDGFSIDADQANRVADDIAFLTTSGDADDIQQASDLAGDFDVANSIQAEVHRFRRMKAVDRAEELTRLEEDLRTDGASASGVELLKALKKTSADVDRALETDPRGHLQREGLVEDAALDFSSAENLIGSLSSRETGLGKQLAGEPVGILTAAESQQLSQVYDQAEIEERVALLGVLTAGAGDNAEATLQQIASSGHDQMALMGSLVMEGRGSLARDIMRGETILASDSGIKPKRIDYQFSVDDAWGAAMSDHPETRAVFLNAAFSKYAELKGRTADLTDEFQSNLMEQALKEVLPTANFNGRRIAVPGGVTERRFDDWTDNWTPETFAQFLNDDDVWMAVPGVTSEEMLDLVRDNGRLVELGNGRYAVNMVSAASGLEATLQNPDGSPFMLQFPRQEQ